MSRKHQDHAKLPVHIVWVQRHRSFNLRQGSLVLTVPRKDKSEHGMSKQQISIELYRLARQLVRKVQGARIEKVAVQGEGPSGRMRVRQKVVGTGVVRVNGK